MLRLSRLLDGLTDEVCINLLIEPGFHFLTPLSSSFPKDFNSQSIQ